MNYQDIYAVFVTDNLSGTKDFFVKYLDFEVVFESSFFVLLNADSGERPLSIAFLDTVHPSSPPDLPAMNAAAGVFLTLQVSDAAAVFDRLKTSGIDMHYTLKDEPWGQRRFGIIDPNGMYIDIVEQIEPVSGFWERYMPVQ
jgi:catechol 2,3-dioxygenase-like lactoylglutathione lyase family enzyme